MSIWEEKHRASWSADVDWSVDKGLAETARVWDDKLQPHNAWGRGIERPTLKAHKRKTPGFFLLLFRRAVEPPELGWHALTERSNYAIQVWGHNSCLTASKRTHVVGWVPDDFSRFRLQGCWSEQIHYSLLLILLLISLDLSCPNVGPMVLQRPTCWEARRKPGVVLQLQWRALCMSRNKIHLWRDMLFDFLTQIFYTCRQGSVAECGRPHSEHTLSALLTHGNVDDQTVGREVPGASAELTMHRGFSTKNSCAMLRFPNFAALFTTVVPWPFRSLMHLSSAEATLGRRPRSHRKMISNTLTSWVSSNCFITRRICYKTCCSLCFLATVFCHGSMGFVLFIMMCKMWMLMLPCSYSVI